MAPKPLFSRPYIAALIAGVVMFCTVYVVDEFLARIKLHAEATILDDLLLGILVGTLVLTLELQHQRQIREQQHKIAVIRQMNHHVRNALQTILYVTFSADKTSSEQVKEAAKRIEWALREILPAEYSDGGAESSDGGEEDRWPNLPPQSR